MSHDFDTRLRTAWHDAGEALTPQVQGRLRAGRRTALASAPRMASRLRWIGIPAGAFAAVAAVALLAPRVQPPQAVPVAAVQGTPAATAIVETDVSDLDRAEALALEDDPDFYLWLDGIAPAPRSEVRHDPT